MRKLLIIAVFLFLILSPTPTLAKDYYFKDVTIEYNIQKDGSIYVNEKRTFSFDGSFSWAEEYIPLRGLRQGHTQAYPFNVEISNFQVFLEDETLPLETSRKTVDGEDSFYAKWYYEAINEEKTFEIQYILSGAITGYQDINEFFWQPIGGGWNKPTRQAKVIVYLPEGAEKEEIFVFGHGPLSGQSKIVSPTLLEFTAHDLAPGQYLEIRVLFPKQLVLASQSLDSRTLSSILDEEKSIVEKTITEAKKARYMDIILQGGLYLYLLIGAIGTLAWPFFYLHYWSKFGMNYHTPTPEYVKEPPSGLAPASVEALLEQEDFLKSISTSAFVATIFDLARRGFLEIRDESDIKAGFFGLKRTYKTYLKTKVGKSVFGDQRQIRPFEKKVIGYIYGGLPEEGEELTFKDIQDAMKHHPQEFQGVFKRWQEQVEEHLRSLEVMEDEGGKIAKKFWIGTFLLTLFASPAILLGIPLIPKLKRRAYPWEYEARRWQAFRRFLNDFSKFKEIPPEAYKLWDVYLVFGILFGSTKKILKLLPVILEDPRAAQPTWFIQPAGLPQLTAQNVMGLESIQHLSKVLDSTANSLAKASLSASHYSSGGGGGFSGGFGGGGFGGGGGGGGGAG